MTPSELLIEARDYIKAHGWYQLAWFSPVAINAFRPPACTLGGIIAVLYRGPRLLAGLGSAEITEMTLTSNWAPLYNEATGFLRKAITDAPSATQVIPAWNDWMGRTKQDVIDAFDRAIALAQSVEQLEPIADSELVPA